MDPASPTPAPPASPVPPGRGPLFRVARIALAAVVGVVAVAAVLWAVRPVLTAEDVERVVLTTLSEEAEASFLVTGTLTFGVMIEERTTTRLLPGVLDLSMGTRTATVQVPTRAAYGFDVGQLRPSDIRFADDGAVEVDLPALRVFSVEPMLERARIRTDEGGWMRLRPTGGREEVRRALGAVRPAAQEQAERDLAGADQPRLNAARAVTRMLTPPLRAAGLDAPRYRIRVGPGTVFTLDPGSSPGAGGRRDPG